MDADLVTVLPVAIWGFVVGVVGWGSCFRLIRPIAELLAPSKGRAGWPQISARLIVVVFLLVLILLLLTLLPMVLVVAGGAEGAEWRKTFGLAFLASLVGLAFLGLLRGQTGD